MSKYQNCELLAKYFELVNDPACNKAELRLIEAELNERGL